MRWKPFLIMNNNATVRRSSIHLLIFFTDKTNKMHTTFSKKQYTTETNTIQAILDPRFDALISRATTRTRSNQISPETNIPISSPNSDSNTSLDPTLKK